MDKLSLPKETKEKMTIIDQVKMGLCCYALGLLFTSFTGSPLFQYIGHMVYWGILLVSPAVPWNMVDDPVKSKKFKVAIRICSLLMILYPLNQLLPLN